MKEIKHRKTIQDLFSYFHEDWMSESDKKYINKEILNLMGKTIEDLDSEIEQGVKNGYSPERQMAMIREFIIL